MNRTNPRETSHTCYENDGKRCRPSHSSLPPAYRAEERTRSLVRSSSSLWTTPLAKSISCNSSPVVIPPALSPPKGIPACPELAEGRLVRAARVVCIPDDSAGRDLLFAFGSPFSFPIHLVTRATFAIDSPVEDSWTFDRQLSAKSASSKDSWANCSTSWKE